MSYLRHASPLVRMLYAAHQDIPTSVRTVVEHELMHILATQKLDGSLPSIVDAVLATGNPTLAAMLERRFASNELALDLKPDDTGWVSGSIDFVWNSTTPDVAAGRLWRAAMTSETNGFAILEASRAFSLSQQINPEAAMMIASLCLDDTLTWDNPSQKMLDIYPRWRLENIDLPPVATAAIDARFTNHPLSWRAAFALRSSVMSLPIMVKLAGIGATVEAVQTRNITGLKKLFPKPKLDTSSVHAMLLLLRSLPDADAYQALSHQDKIAALRTALAPINKTPPPKMRHDKDSAEAIAKRAARAAKRAAATAGDR